MELKQSKTEWNLTTASRFWARTGSSVRSGANAEKTNGINGGAA